MHKISKFPEILFKSSRPIFTEFDAHAGFHLWAFWIDIDYKWTNSGKLHTSDIQSHGVGYDSVGQVCTLYISVIFCVHTFVGVADVLPRSIGCGGTSVNVIHLNRIVPLLLYL